MKLSTVAAKIIFITLSSTALVFMVRMILDGTDIMERDHIIDSLKFEAEIPARIERTILAAYPSLNFHRPTVRYLSLMINEESKRMKIPWSIITAKIWIESGFNPTLRSDSNACGLMQMLEATIAAECDSAGIKYKRNSTVWNEFENFYCGVRYIQRGIKSNGVDFARFYVGGPGWERRTNPKTVEYIEKYATTIEAEKTRLDLIYSAILESEKSK